MLYVSANNYDYLIIDVRGGPDCRNK